MTRPKLNRKLGVERLLLGSLCLYLALLLPKLVWLEPSGLWVGHEHLWSDWPLHIGMLRRFSDCPPDSWLSQHPMVGGTSLHYPFFAAFISGMLVRLGCSVPVALVAPMYAGFGLLLWGMYRLTADQPLPHPEGTRPSLTAPPAPSNGGAGHTGKGRSIALLSSGTPITGGGGGMMAITIILLFFLSAGPDGWEWLAQIRANGMPALLLPPKEYGRVDDYQWYAGNFLVGMLLTQRAFLPGMAAAVWILVWLRRAVETGERRLFVLCGIAAGLLPIVHIHSLFAVIVFGLFMVLKRFKTALLYAALPGAVIAGALYLLLLRPAFPYPGFMSFHPFFVAPSPKEWPLMWWRLWGMALPAAIAGALLGGRGPLFWGGLTLFALGNLVLFQPIPWDNSKVFLWAYFGLCSAMAYLLQWLWAQKWYGKPMALLLTLHLTITGVANFVHLWRTDQHRAMVLSASDTQVGEKIRRDTPPNAVFLSAADVSNAPMVWGARPIYMGFGGWMPNFGVPPVEAQRREAVIRTVLEGKPEAPAVARQNGISYIYVGPSERSSSWRANDAAISALFPLWYEAGDTRIYKVSE